MKSNTLNAPDPLSIPILARRALRLLDAAGPSGLAEPALAASLRSMRDRPETPDQQLADALRLLAARGEAARWGGRWRALARCAGFLGHFEEETEGGGRVRSGPRRDRVHRVLAGDRGAAREGDLVFCAPIGGPPPRRRPGELPIAPRAAVRCVVDRPRRRRVGRVAVDPALPATAWLEPFDPRVEPSRLEPAPGLAPGVWVVAEADPGAGAGAPWRAVEVLGGSDEPGADLRVVLAHHQLADEFPAEVVAEMPRFPSHPRPEDLAGRESLEAETVVTIDGESARDFDDALSARRLSAGGFRLGVHIADVSHYVAESSPLDREALARATSAYFPERAIPMLPESLSNGLCSLVPGAPRLTLSAFLDVGPDGGLRASRFARTWIRSTRRLTYDGARQLLEAPAPAAPGGGDDVQRLLEDLRDLAAALLADRRARGSLDFDLPEGDIVLDAAGRTEAIRPGERHLAHRIVEECMIAANRAVALELATPPPTGLFRVHDAPTAEAASELAGLLAPLGYELGGVDGERLPVSRLAALLERAKGRPEEAFVNAVVLRSMSRARYEPECLGHYALGLAHYAHFTSPIRRYPDLVVHRQLKKRIAAGGRGSGDGEDAALAERTSLLAEHCSERERKVESAERDLLQWKKVRFLADRVGDTFTGRITGVQSFGVFVELDELAIAGLVPIAAVGEDYWEFEPEGHRLVGRHGGEVVRLADPITVLLVGIDERRRGLKLRRVAPGSSGAKR